MAGATHTFFWYDLETFGTNPQTDRIAQFAGIRTDLDMNVVGEPIVCYCKVSPDFLPDPLSCLVTHITPQTTLKAGLCEDQFITKINAEFCKPNTCVVGYNNIKFDDEFIRYALYRNLLDPYLREYAFNNSRWDLINVVRMCHDLRPGGIIWPTDEEGKVSFKLEALTKANNISHEHAHDALADVYATIEVAKLIKKNQPKFFQFLYSNRSKQAVTPYVDIYKKKPFLFTSIQFYHLKRYTSVVMPIANDIKRRNKFYCIDLTSDVEDFINLPAKEIQYRIFQKHDELIALGVKPLKIYSLQINQAPTIAPLSTLQLEDAKRLGIDLELCEKNHKLLSSNSTLWAKFIEVFNPIEESQSRPKSEFATLSSDPDFALYDNLFFSDKDREKMHHLRSLEPDKILTANMQFDDPRLPEMVWRYVCRNYPEVLNENELQRWKSFCASRLLVPPGRISDYNFFMRKVNEHLQNKNIDSSDKLVLQKLLIYGKKMGEKILGLSPNSQF